MIKKGFVPLIPKNDISEENYIYDWVSNGIIDWHE